MKGIVQAPQICFYGDDFTGASDTLATATAAGLRSLLFLRLPNDRQLRAAGALDCLGVAGAARSMAPDAMRAELTPVAEWFATLNAPVTHYKICSTFDSAPHVGNIGVALSVWRRHIGNDFVALVGGQPNLQRYCAFSNLFAAVRSGMPPVRIDRHDTMRQHPVTPMVEADLREHLRAQQMTVAALHAPWYEADKAAIDAEVQRLIDTRPDAILFDVTQNSQLAQIGRQIWQRALRQPLLAIGASSVVQALCAHWQHCGALVQQESRAVSAIAPASGPVFVLAGSLSPVTARQIGAASSFERIQIDAGRLVADQQDYRDAMLQQIVTSLNAGRHVLAYTSDHSQAHQDFGVALAQASGDLLRRVLALTRLRRIGVAGGDTSSHALKALDIWGLSYLGQLAPGVALCHAHADGPAEDGVQLMLKGGQMGADDLFERLVHGVIR